MARAGYRLGDLAARVGGTVRGDSGRVLRGVAPLDRAGPDELSFLTNPRYRAEAEATRAGAVLVAPGSDLEGPDLIEADEPYLALAGLLELFHPPAERVAELSPLAFVADTATIGSEVSVGPFAVVEDGAVVADGVTVGPGCVIGRDCRIGQATELKPRVVLYPGTRIGAHCLIHAGVVLGGDGFGFATSRGKHHKVPQLGRVVVEDEVEIGANSTVDRGTLDETRIGKGSKIDNLVMIAHGVSLGPGCLLAGQAGIAGSTRLGDHVVFAGQSGAAGHLEIPSGTVVGAKSAVLGPLTEAGFVAGIPAVDHRLWKRSQAAARRLPELRHELRRLQQRVEKLESRLGSASLDEE